MGEVFAIDYRTLQKNNNQEGVIKMKAFLFEAVGKAGLVDRQLREMTERDVKIKVMSCGICGTDIHILRGESLSTPPVVLGHEFAGEVVEVGSQVRGFKVGDRVCVDPNVYCGTCYYCQRGVGHLCENLTAFGVDMDGGFAEYAIIPETHVYLLPDNLSYDEGAMVEPVACCVRGIDLANVRPGDDVAVLGGGPIGLILAQLARAAGGNVTISEPDQEKWELIRRLGFTQISQPQDLPENTFNVVIEAVGIPQTIEQSIKVARKGASIVWFSVVPKGQGATIEPFEVYRKELRISSSFINPYTHSRAIKLLAEGHIEVAPLITHSYPLSQIMDGFAKQQAPDSIKVVIRPHE